METFGTVANAVVGYMRQTGVGAFTLNANIDILTLAMNNARRWAEKLHDFKYSEADLFLSIASGGSTLDGAYADSSVTAAGTLSPNVAGAFALTGTYNGLPFYTKTVSSVVYFLAFSGTAWNITAGGFTVGSNYWGYTTTSSNPAGAYTPHGTNTGTLTITQVTGSVSVKKVQNVFLPVAGGDYYPVEFLLNDEWNRRQQIQIGKEPYNPAKTLAQIGVSNRNPVCVQQAQTLEILPASNLFTYPIVAKLSVTKFLQDYVNTTDTDFFLQRAPEFMLWQAILEVNRYFWNFTMRQEGKIDEALVTASRDAAFASLLAWDASISGGTTTPAAPPAPPQPPPQKPQ